MTDYLNKDGFLTHLRNLEDKYGKQLNNSDFNLDDLEKSDSEDYQAILNIRKLVKEKRNVKIRHEDLLELLNTELTINQIAETLNCSASKIQRMIKSDIELYDEYKGMLSKRRKMIFNNLKLQNSRKKIQAGKRILRLRKKHNLTQTEVANEINRIIGTTTCSAPTVSNWERGVALPNKERLDAIAKLWNIPTEKITGDD